MATIFFPHSLPSAGGVCAFHLVQVRKLNGKAGAKLYRNYVLFIVIVNSVNNVRSNALYASLMKTSSSTFEDILPVLQVYALGEDIQNCFDEIGKWMNEYFLRLNANKTKILIILPPRLRTSIVIRGTFINGDCIRFAHSARNLGVILDDELPFEEQIIEVVQTCFLSI